MFDEGPLSAEADARQIAGNDREADQPDRCSRGKCDRLDHHPTVSPSLQCSLVSRKRSFEHRRKGQIGTGRSQRGPRTSHMRD